MAKTLPAILQNIKDAWEIMKYRMSDTGFYKKIVGAFTQIYVAILKITERKETIQAISDALSALWKPVELAIKALVKFVDYITVLAKENPKLFKTLAVFTAISGVTVFLAGRTLSLVAGFLQVISSFGIVAIYMMQLATAGKNGVNMLSILGMELGHSV
jgi:hypothetical protein